MREMGDADGPDVACTGQRHPRAEGRRCPDRRLLTEVTRRVSKSLRHQRESSRGTTKGRSSVRRLSTAAPKCRCRSAWHPCAWPSPAGGWRGRARRRHGACRSRRGGGSGATRPGLSRWRLFARCRRRPASGREDANGIGLIGRRRRHAAPSSTARRTIISTKCGVDATADLQTSSYTRLFY